MHKGGVDSVKISLYQVIDALAGFDLSYPDDFDPETSYSGIELFANQPIEVNTLYVAQDAIPEGAERASFIVASEHANPTEGGLHVAGASAPIVANALMHHTLLLSRTLDNMREKLYEHHDIQGFCEVIAHFAGNPAIAYDAALLPSGQAGFPKDVALDLFGSDKADRDFVLRTIPDWKRQEGEDVFARTDARRLEDATGRMSTVACNVISAEGFQGYLELFEVNKPITDGQMELLEEAARIAATSPFPFGESGLALSHLQGRPIQGDLTASWLSALHWRKDDGVYVIAISVPTDRLDDKLYIDHIIRMTRLVVPYSVSQQMGEMPVLVANNRLVGREQAVEHVAAFLEKLGEGAYVGASEVFEGVSRVHEGFVHAQFAARYARKTQDKSHAAKSVALFEECRFAFFSELCNLEENTPLIVDADIARMFADDARSGSENVSTIKTYIETGFNLNATAKLLSVHRNTIAYRLKHIAERYGIDLSSPIDDPDLVFQVLLSAKALLGDS